jgi:plasmid stability protein
VAQLLVRNLDPGVVKKLRLKAARAGVSMEEEHRRILRGALGVGPGKGRALPGKKSGRKRPRMDFKQFLLSMPNVGDDRVFERDRSPMRKSPF